jgi:hypothetical protein
MVQKKTREEKEREKDKEKEWLTLKLARQLIEDIDRFRNSDVGRRLGITSRQDLVSRVMTAWFASYDPRYDFFDKRRLWRAMEELHNERYRPNLS